MKRWFRCTWQDAVVLVFGFLVGALTAYITLSQLIDQGFLSAEVGQRVLAIDAWVQSVLSGATIEKAATFGACLFAYLSAKTAADQYKWSRLEAEFFALSILVGRLDAIKNCIEIGFSRKIVECYLVPRAGTVFLNDPVSVIQKEIIERHRDARKEVPRPYRDQIAETEYIEEAIKQCIASEPTTINYKAGDPKITEICDRLRESIWKPYAEIYNKHNERLTKLSKQREALFLGQ